jgi:hypothetical protein
VTTCLWVRYLIQVGACRLVPWVSTQRAKNKISLAVLLFVLHCVQNSDAESLNASLGHRIKSDRFGIRLLKVPSREEDFEVAALPFLKPGCFVFAPNTLTE